MNREKRPIKMGFPFGFYLRQLYSTNTYARFINPFSFWHRYKINHLETCRELDIVRQLESCYQLDCRVAKPANIKLARDYIDIPTHSLIKQAKLNTIYVSQPRIELKYRGISYYIRNILNTNINLVKIDPSVVRSNSLKDVGKFNSPNTTKKTGSN